MSCDYRSVDLLWNDPTSVRLVSYNYFVKPLEAAVESIVEVVEDVSEAIHDASEEVKEAINDAAENVEKVCRKCF